MSVRELLEGKCGYSEANNIITAEANVDFWVMEPISHSVIEAPDYKSPKLRLFAALSGSSGSNGNH